MKFHWGVSMCSFKFQSEFAEQCVFSFKGPGQYSDAETETENADLVEQNRGSANHYGNLAPNNHHSEQRQTTGCES